MIKITLIKKFETEIGCGSPELSSLIISGEGSYISLPDTNANNLIDFAYDLGILDHFKFEHLEHFCNTCAFSADESEFLTCHYAPPISDGKWPAVQANDFCSKWLDKITK